MSLDEGVSREQWVRAWAQWLPGLNTRVDLTLKQAMRTVTDAGVEVLIWMDQEQATRVFIRFMNRLNATLLRGRRRHGVRLGALAWVERGTLGGRWHIHALIERPATLNHHELTSLVERVWSRQPFSYAETRIEPVEDLFKCIRYNSKASRLFENLIYWDRDRNGATSVALGKMPQPHRRNAISCQPETRPAYARKD